jgi:S-adenosylmethionine decarboxylase
VATVAVAALAVALEVMVDRLDTNKSVLITQPLAAFSPRGTHILADFWGVDENLLTDAPCIEIALRAAASAAQANIISCHLHRFGGADSAQKTGITGVLLLAESHLSIHTWPEYGMAAIDIYLCGTADAHIALTALIQAFKPLEQIVHTQARGIV